MLASGIIQLLVILLPVILAALAEHNENAAKLSRANKQIDEDIAKHNAGNITIRLNTMLGQLQDGDSNK